MKLYLAGIFTSNFDKAGKVYLKLDDAERRMRDSVEYFLESYHYIHRQSFVEKIRREGVKVFLDSGAFSAFSQGVEIDLDAYCEYIKRNKDIVDFASVLDSIGSASGTWKNQAAIERNNVNVLPCFHYGEDMEVGRYYVKNYKHFTLGGLVPVSTPQMQIWLDRVWKELLTDQDGKPVAKIHGFGVTSLPLMFRYPWDSVDSSTWVQWAAMGMILLPKSGKQIDVSDKSSRRKQAGQHLDSMPKIQRQAIEDEIAEYGVDPDRLRRLYYSRWAWNAWAFPEYVKMRGGGIDRFVPQVMELI